MIVKAFKVNLDILKSRNLVTIDAELHKDHPLFLESRKVTTEIMRLARRKAAGTPIVAFSYLDQTRMWVGDVLQEMTGEAGWYYVPDVSKKIYELKAGGVTVDGGPANSHWNMTGHQLAGQTIDRFLIERGLLKSDPLPDAAGN